jgi:uncharacterized protein YigE (DUF2233 family)
LIARANRLSPWAFALLAVLWCSQTAWAECRNLTSANNSYTACTVDVNQQSLGLFNLDPYGQPYGNFSALGAKLGSEGKILTFAMNAGMFDQNLKAIGYYVEDGKQLKKLNRKNGSGNFHMKPNGVFYVKGQKSGVMETEAFAKSGIKPDLASQSGPMLVINGALHPKISASGTSRKIRNGVGMTDDHTLVFVISNNAITFYEFAQLFQTELACPNALFLDGTISSIHSSELNRTDGFLPIGPIVGTYEMR